MLKSIIAGIAAYIILPSVLVFVMALLVALFFVDVLVTGGSVLSFLILGAAIWAVHHNIKHKMVN